MLATPLPPAGNAALTAAFETAAVVDVLAGDEELRRRASPGAWEAGIELKDQGLANLRLVSRDRIEAMVWDGRAEEVELQLTERGLAWSCSCGLSGALGYCSHAVATILLNAERQRPAG
jgi:uncharacterized Zn finger protein